MKRAVQLFKAIDVRVTRWMARYAVMILRVGLGVVFLWFGVLKFFPSLSPAEALATKTIETLTFGIVQPQLALPLLATLETLIGLGLLTGKLMRLTLLLLLFQMLGTVTPLFLFPSETFTHFPYAPTLEGQYIIKNIVLVAAGLVIGATVRGGAVIADPEAAKLARMRESSAAAD
ncbi:MAG: hypothetical protein CUN49_08590 [Candidatus Thermofonsia Clade 1 bacterium]|jgi:uncharacterized membrane protein YphA (DoxX/SURF4 family)|uniref:DoxX family protein n=1 Tax=Candidatus Thermofonsia Clade 1 bacterium TaxID=2364210 RepID=A0A2M8PYW0_9CHLR|nr:MAG: hypothetical protein CUN49_08590 [Candidatus Thermofonsia Clade 1 bacterium]PJF42739.1 MAG: hypothetical protein CUN50_03100 [Candidatus Thermofonsia Clade 1 bacterium]RMF52553.1 MAG: DoxX family membrane protein [Chloroflexota bacterium]